MKKSLIGLLSFAFTTQVLAFGIQIDTSKRANLVENKDKSQFSLNSDDIWEKFDDLGVSLEKYMPKLGSPIHENITKEAMKIAGLNSETSWLDYNNKTAYAPDEVLTGLLWNDDPDGNLFPYEKFQNPKGFKGLNGTKWLIEFAKLEIFIHKRTKALKELPKLKERHAKLTQSILNFKPISPSSHRIYDRQILELNSINSRLKEIQEIEDRFHKGDLKEMAKISNEIKDQKRTLKQIEKNIANADYNILSMKDRVKIKLKRKGSKLRKDLQKKLISAEVKNLEKRKKRIKGHIKQLEKKVSRLIQFSPIKNNIMYASHFGDLQYLHSMGSGNQSRDEVKAQIMSYARHAWKTATTELSFKQQRKRILNEQRRIRKAGIGTNDFRERFIITDLLYHTKDPETLRYRALGSLLHMVQDSYAKGHTVRRNWEANRGDENANTANSGAIRFFQDYSQQGEGEESHADHDVNHDDPENFLDIPGARMAVRRSAQLITYFMRGCTWDNKENIKDCPEFGVKDYLDNSVFKLVPEIEENKIDPNQDGNLESSKTRSHPKLAPKHIH
jgi:hypothetical protein